MRGFRTLGIRSTIAAARHMVGDLLYERRYRIRTSGRVILDIHDAESINYIAVNWRQLPRVLPPDSVTNQDVFIDLGSGMGRAVLEAAARYPFARVIGVELSEELHDIARQNLVTTSRRLRCTNVELIRADLREYRLPDDVTVIFVNNSIRGSIFERMLGEISASIKRNPRRIRFVYTNPLEEAAMLATGEWRKTRTVASRRSNWPYGVSCVYEWSGGESITDQP
jgi:SAM-dependent methyltransferase